MRDRKTLSGFGRPQEEHRRQKEEAAGLTRRPPRNLMQAVKSLMVCVLPENDRLAERIRKVLVMTMRSPDIC